MRASLLLEDGTVFHGQGLGIETDIVGEIVFNTAMSGYEEVISDPSYLVKSFYLQRATLEIQV